jgi:glycosyltransferase involved in cell wall biosynthesis
MLNPEVSVVITTYNEENFIEKAIKSVLNQTLPKNMYELIVIDDGGVDSTQDIISNLQSKTDFEIKYTKKNNGGTASARNLGVSKSSAPFISFLDGDDFYDPRKLEESLKFMRKGDSVGIVYSDYIEQYPDRAQLRLKMNFDRELLFKECIVSTNSMVRRSAIERVGGFDESFKYIEDYDLWCRIILSGYFALRVPIPLFTYNSHKASKTNSTNIEKINPEWETIYERIRKNEWKI